MKLRLFAMLALIASASLAEDVKPVKDQPKDQPVVMSEVQARDVVISQLQSQILDLQGQLNDKEKQLVEASKQLQAIRQDALIKGICSDKKIAIEECSIDPKTGQVNRKPPAQEQKVQSGKPPEKPKE
jgi:hypothetical protein